MSQKKISRMKHVVKFREIENTVRKFTICLIKVPEEEKRENVAEEIFEKLMADNCPEVMTKTNLPVQEGL